MDEGSEPTAEELLFEELHDRAKKLLTKQWYDTREGRIMSRLEERPHLAAMYAAFLAAQERFIEENLEMTVEDLLDERAYYKNPLQYYGLSQGNFL
jgi:hypothetical protein